MGNGQFQTEDMALTELQNSLRVTKRLLIIFKPKIDENVVKSLDEFVDMSNRSRIIVSDEDLDMVHKAIQRGYWYSPRNSSEVEREAARTIVLRPVKFFKPELFMKNVWPGLERISSRASKK
ncbi:MAG: hypothetical protein WC725_03275 [Patescibacteria group bacterium]|jgi:hypothetical protein